MYMLEQHIKQFLSSTNSEETEYVENQWKSGKPRKLLLK